eukprot:1161503-Pelagomonas_calceolata.AAC.15
MQGNSCCFDICAHLQTYAMLSGLIGSKQSKKWKIFIAMCNIRRKCMVVHLFDSQNLQDLLVEHILSLMHKRVLQVTQKTGALAAGEDQKAHSLRGCMIR